MSETLTEPRFVRITGSAEAPAVFLPGWLPDIETFPELAQARAEWMRLRDAWQAAGERRRVAEAKIENDLKRRELALRDAYLAGEDAKLEPEDEALKAQVVEARVQGQAALSAFLEHINRTIALVIERREAWFAAIDEYQLGIDEQIEALAQQAARLRTERGNFARFEHWVERTGGRVRPATAGRPGVNFCGADEPHAHHPYSEIAMPPASGVREEEARMVEWFTKIYAGWKGEQKPLSAEQGAALEQHVISGRNAAPVQGGEVELNDLEPDELVDWLLSTGRFDGRPKPGPDVVVAAAEGDPDMAQRLLKAERTANESAPREAVVTQLSQIGGAQ